MSTDTPLVLAELPASLSSEPNRQRLMDHLRESHWRYADGQRVASDPSTAFNIRSTTVPGEFSRDDLVALLTDLGVDRVILPEQRDEALRNIPSKGYGGQKAARHEDHFHAPEKSGAWLLELPNGRHALAIQGRANIDLLQQTGIPFTDAQKVHDSYIERIAAERRAAAGLVER